MSLRFEEVLTVNPNTATFEKVHNGKHFGQINCPYCEKPVIAVGPEKGLGLVWAYPDKECKHCHGAIAGHGYEICIAFQRCKP